MKCESVREDLAAYLDDEIEGASRRAIDDHLSGCAACAAERDAQAAAWKLLDLAPPPLPREGFDARLREGIRAGAAARGRLLRFPIPAAAAAAVLLALGGAALLMRERPESADAPPETLLSDLTVLESLDLLEDGDLDLVDRLDEFPEEDLEVLGG